jgi:hypothetical protein
LRVARSQGPQTEVLQAVPSGSGQNREDRRGRRAFPPWRVKRKRRMGAICFQSRARREPSAMTVQDTANLGLLHRQFSVRRPERVSGHSCFRLESRGHTQHEMGASIAVGRWRRNVRGRHPAFHRSDRCFRSRWTAKAFTRNRSSRVFSYFRDPSTRATQHCGAAAGGTTSSSRSPSSVSTGNPSAAAGATRGFSCSGGPFLLLRQESRIS